MRKLSNDAARRIAVSAQGLAEPRPRGRIDIRHFRRLLLRIGVLQLDSVNVLSRSHYLPVLARVGSYDTKALDRYTSGSHEVVEYWGHMASLLPAEHYALFRWRMDGMTPWRIVRKIEEEHPGYMEAVFEKVAENGPLTVGGLEEAGERTGPWWGYGRGKTALEYLFACGRLASYRGKNFVRMYDLPERVIPADALAATPPSQDEAFRQLLMLSARQHGIGTARDLIDYYRLNLPTARPFVEELADAGALERVNVDGWKDPAFIHPEASLPRQTEGAALLSPFDSLVWERDRTERIFGFHYRIEIYVPAPKRIHGYYVLPFLLDGELVARVDLKSDRKDGKLHVRSSFIEKGRQPSRVARPLARELRTMAEWLGLGDVVVTSRGNLASVLRKAI